jgi:hypothetical protein
LLLRNKFLEVSASVLAFPVHAYICRQRDRLESHATPLPDHDRKALSEYFTPQVLDTVRIVHADPLPIPNPPFASLIRRLGFDFLSPSSVAAITFDNVVACRIRIDTSLLFHELVHVVQYRTLGVRKFAQQYVVGFLETQSYPEIPLEKSAFDLQLRFETDTLRFDAEAEIRRHLTQK